MLKTVRGQKIRLSGFNNLTKSLSFNIYDVCYAQSPESQKKYLEYLDQEYDSARLGEIIEQVVCLIDAKLVNMTTQDYDPRGASVVALVNENQPVLEYKHTSAGGIREASFVGHLDKSHITAHTYPEYDAATGLSTFRVDIDVSTCGMIGPLRALNFLIDSFESDVVQVDYRVRGFTRDVSGKKVFLDHDITSIQDFVADDVLGQYLAYDINVLSDHIFHTKMRKKRLVLQDYLFGPELEGNLEDAEHERISRLLEKEIQEIFECENF